MRTTVTLEPDTTAAVELVRSEQGVGVSAAVNELIRRGLRTVDQPTAFVQRTSAGRARIDLVDVADALDLLDGTDGTDGTAGTAGTAGT